jgi:hypothetical protein
MGMDPDLVWFDLAPNHGVLEFHERLTAGIGLELHVMVCADDRIVAWWESDDGVWPWVAEVGAA